MIGTLADFRTYATARGDTAPASANDADANAALTRGSDYILYSYVSRFLAGYDETSANVEEAAYEAAMIELGTPNFFSKTYTPAEQKVLTEVKGIKWTVVGEQRGVEGSTPTSTKIEAMLRDYLDRLPASFAV